MTKIDKGILDKFLEGVDLSNPQSIFTEVMLTLSHGQKMVSINQLEMDMKLFCYAA
ncbi:hypothetical protein [Mycoavidus sp. SF9855]|uniref:hypothetical protein n=1 Tax=Mycoavidus sp. SF9855 TaxID=2968475 RepID=UPI00211C3B89|nr:hypothetical protein [Mycoavidus sp. SF9855]UUM21340.1 hypothetical protein NQD60_07865 [Mycoavidus sp. SF9855]